MYRQTNIGDIVKPKGRNRRKAFGSGIVVEVDENKRYPVTVIFPSKEKLFSVWDFSYGGLLPSEAGVARHKSMVNAAYNYRQLQKEIVSI